MSLLIVQLYEGLRGFPISQSHSDDSESWKLVKCYQTRKYTALICNKVLQRYCNQSIQYTHYLLLLYWFSPRSLLVLSSFSTRYILVLYSFSACSLLVLYYSLVILTPSQLIFYLFSSRSLLDLYAFSKKKLQENYR